MKAKTKRKIKHTLTRKQLLKKKASERLLRAFLIGVLSVSASSLTLAIAATDPEVNLTIGTEVKPVASVQVNPPKIIKGPDQVGQASWYALGLPQPDALTCASTTYPRKTYLHVTNLRNGKSVICRVNDYGPEAWTKRVIDLSRGSFRAIENLSRGTTPVEIRVVQRPTSIMNFFSPISFSRAWGYQLCHKRHSREFCEDNRQTQRKL